VAVFAALAVVEELLLLMLLPDVAVAVDIFGFSTGFSSICFHLSNFSSCQGIPNIVLGMLHKRKKKISDS